MCMSMLVLPIEIIQVGSARKEIEMTRENNWRIHQKVKFVDRKLDAAKNE